MKMKCTGRSHFNFFESFALVLNFHSLLAPAGKYLVKLIIIVLGFCGYSSSVLDSVSGLFIFSLGTVLTDLVIWHL